MKRVLWGTLLGTIVISFLYVGCRVEANSDFGIADTIDVSKLTKLPFDFSESPSQKSNSNEQSKTSSSLIASFEKCTTATEAFNQFKKEFNRVEKMTMPELFSHFSSRMDAFTQIEKSTVQGDSLAAEWVTMALAEKDESIRDLFSQYGHIFRSQKRFNLYVANYATMIRPNEEFFISGYPINSGESDIERYSIEIAKLQIDEKLQIKGFTKLSTDSVFFKSENERYRNEYGQYRYTPTVSGVYRLTFSSKTEFQQFYFQAGWLDGVVKTDHEKIVVWGSSFKDSVPGPYTIHYVSNKGEYFSQKTNSDGIAMVAHGIENQKDRTSQDLKILIQKGSEIAFLSGYVNQQSSDSQQVNYLYTDRPAYRPGNVVHFNGISRQLIQNREFRGNSQADRGDSAKTDSVEVVIQDPQWNEILRKKIALDSWGHFGDSLILSETAKQGNYSISVQGTNHYGRSGNGQFLVEAYKKPEFSITATPSKEVFSVDESVNIAVHGEYYFGGALAKIPVKIRWYRQDLFHYFSYWNSKRSCSFIPTGERTLLNETVDTLDNSGNLSLSYKNAITQEQEYLIAEIIATDASRREIRAEANVKVVKSDGYLNVILDKWNYETGDTANMEIIAVDMIGKPLSGKVTLRIKKDNQIIDEQTLPISKDGSAFVEYPLVEEGHYLFEVSAKDRRGKTIYREVSISVAKENRDNWNWERLEITTDKETYAFGDTATITVKSGANNTNILCAVEGEKIWQAKVKKINDNTVEYRMIIAPYLGYSIVFSASLSGKERFASESKQIAVVDSSSLLRVTVKGNTVLKPGEQFTGELLIKDRSGKPVAANFSVALVDEAIFAVAEASKQSSQSYYWDSEKEETGVLSIVPRYFSNNVYSQFNEFNPSFIREIQNVEGAVARQSEIESTDKNRPKDDVFGKGGYASGADDVLGSATGGEAKEERAMKKDAMPKSVMAQGSMPAPIVSEPAPRERNNFKDLGYWNSSITSNESGIAKLSFAMPDDLTKWRLVLVGSDGEAQFIDFHDFIITKQDIMVKLQAPRSVVEGDTVVLTSVVHNYADKMIDATVSFSFKDDITVAKLLGESSQKLQIKKGETKRVDWNVVILKPGKLSWHSAVNSSIGGDAEMRSYPILVNGIVQTTSFVGNLDGTKLDRTISLALPQNGRKGSRQVTLHYAPSLVYSLYESLDYLTGYPYGCVEQTMSRFLPNLYVANLQKRLNLPSDSLTKMIPEYTTKGIERLGQLQNADGSWGWWQSGSADSRMTALVLYGLRYAQTASFLSESDRSRVAKMINSGEKAVETILANSNTSLEDKVSLRYSSSAVPANVVKELYAQRGKLSVSSLAMLLEMAHKAGCSIEKKSLISLIISKATVSENSANWQGSSEYQWYNQSEEVTARVVRALSITDSKNPILEKGVFWLSHQKRNGFWVSTKTTATVVEALSHFMVATNELKPNYSASIVLNGKTILSKTLKVQDRGEIVLSEKDLGAGNLSLSMKGSGRLYYSVNLRYVTAEMPIKAHDNGVVVSRVYKKIVYRQNTKNEWIVERVPFDGVLKSGDEMEVTVTVSGAGSYEHLMLEDFFPSGMEVLKKTEEWYSRWCGWWYWGYTHEEARDDRMVFFMDSMRGKQVFTYLLRAETPGVFTALPARAECMYEPSVNGNSASTVVRIVE